MLCEALVSGAVSRALGPGPGEGPSSVDGTCLTSYYSGQDNLQLFFGN